ncbi:putative minor capsid protein [Lactobacillus crispatus]|uniref:putative minor capsid protein n=1 Tax=Lactobacillus crispatus TaxID=47770 RepID=UPI003F264B87
MVGWLKPNKLMCHQKIIFKRWVGIDDDGNSKFDKPIEINNCVVHLRTVYSGSNNDRTIVANGTVMLYKDISEPFVNFSKDDVKTDSNLGSQIIYEGKAYTVTNVNEDIELYSSNLYGYKLQII